MKRSVAKSAKNSSVKNVDAYLARVPDEARAALARLRKIIKSAAPEATEGLFYAVPAFKYHGVLVTYAAFPKHCGFYVMSPSVMEAHKDELVGYDTAMATIRFTPDKPLPAALVRKLVKARIAENEAKMGK